MNLNCVRKKAVRFMNSLLTKIIWWQVIIIITIILRNGLTCFADAVLGAPTHSSSSAWSQRKLWLEVFLLHSLILGDHTYRMGSMSMGLLRPQRLHDSSCVIYFYFFFKAPYCVSAWSRTPTMKTRRCAGRNCGVWVTQIELTSWGVPVEKTHNHCFCLKPVLSQIQL